VPEAPEDLEQYVLNRELTPSGAIVDLLPNQDTYTTSGMPDSNWGSSSNLRVGYNITNGRGAERIYFQFPVEVAPSNVTINKAEMHFYRSSLSPSGDAPMGAVLRHLNSTWNANTLTWNSNLPAWGGVALEGEIPASTGWGTVDLTQFVRQWVSGERANNGFVVIGNETPLQRERSFYSRNTSNSSLRPFLRVDYSVCTDTTPPSVWVNAFPSPWIATDKFTVSWGGDDSGGSGIDRFNVQYRKDNGGWVDWKVGTTSTSAEFTSGDGKYDFRAQAIDKCSNSSGWSSPQTINVDTTPPVSTILPFSTSIIPTTTFGVFWAGSDGNGSGINLYNIYWRFGSNPWSLLTTVPPSTTSTTFNATSGDGPYFFKAEAVDNVGNAEKTKNLPDASIMVDTDGDVLPYMWFPEVFQTTQ
jgi:hypothetical protein